MYSMNSIPLFLGRRIKMARHVARLSQRELGNRIGISGAMVSKYERGTNMPVVALLHRIGTETEMPLEFFFRPGPIWSIAIEHIYKGDQNGC